MAVASGTLAESPLSLCYLAKTRHRRWAHGLVPNVHNTDTDGEVVIMLAFQASGTGSIPVRCIFLPAVLAICLPRTVLQTCCTANHHRYLCERAQKLCGLSWNTPHAQISCILYMYFLCNTNSCYALMLQYYMTPSATTICGSL